MTDVSEAAYQTEALCKNSTDSDSFHVYITKIFESKGHPDVWTLLQQFD